MSYKKENKDCQIKVRITAVQKEKIERYCEAHELNVSQFLRMAIDEIIQKEDIRKANKEKIQERKRLSVLRFKQFAQSYNKKFNKEIPEISGGKE